MDLYPTDDQTEIVDAAADYLARELPAERAPKQEGDRLTDAEWRGLADMGWFGLGLPEASGGLGLSVVEEALIVREFGRQLLPPSALAVILAAHAAAEAGDAELTGDLITGRRRAGIAVASGRVQDGPYRLVDAAGSDVVVAWDDDALLLAELDAFEGREAAKGVDPTVAMMTAKSLPPNKARRVERSTGSILPLRASLLTAAMLTGGAEGMASRAVEYAKVRQQFGRAIGGFQAISHRLAKAAARCEASVAMLQYAAVWLRDGFDHPELEVAAARLVAADAARENAAASMQVFGGYGQTYEFLPHFFLKRALILSALGGGAPADEAAVLEASTTL